MPEQYVRLDQTSQGLELNGSKAFCSGAGLIDRALVTLTVPERRLVEVDLRRNRASLVVDATGWISCAFAQTSTATVVFNRVPILEQDLVCPPGWYLERPGFWHGACGPAACWAGGAIGLIDYARTHARDDPHMRAHLGALHTDAWVMEACLYAGGREIDDCPADARAAHVRALTVRQIIEDCCADVLRRFARAFGPRPLAYDRDLSRRYQELELYIRQSHAEHDLESLGRMVGNS
jgi:alkylation response protein AidB-like acyl-CoA dehydrogenase